MKYRAEIDGLRALAVLPVIFYHAGFADISGGYVGVDVFFVISGYLITTIIYGEMQNGTFSLIRFYERRIRRILPALFVVSFACVPLAWLWMAPSEFVDFSQSLVAVNLFVSNIFFWREAGYFDVASELKPLIHTWSIALEEQFYILFPLALFLLRRIGRKKLLIIGFFITAISLGLAEWASRVQPKSNYYLLPYRFWELEIGVILALGASTWIRREGWLAQFVAAIGLIMILYAVLVFDETVPFPSVWALIPVMGTAFIIAAAGPRNLVGKLLGWRPLVGLGLISYSAYLWHQPLFVFMRFRINEGMTPQTYFGLILLTFVLAYFTWRFVENPCRNKMIISRYQIFGGAAAASVVLTSFGIFGHLSQGIPSRHGEPEFMLTIGQRLGVNQGLSDTCEGVFTLSPDCRTDDAPEIVIWGDSYAMHLVDGVLGSNPQARVVQMTTSGCAPILDIAPLHLRGFNESWVKNCLSFNKQVQKYLLGSKSIKYAVLSSPFDHYVNPGSRVYFDENIIHPEMIFIVDQFAKTLDWLIQHNIRPIVFSPPPSNGANIASCIVRRNWLNINLNQCHIKLDDYYKTQFSVIKFLKEISKNYPVVWMSDYLCDESVCKSEENNIFIYRDVGHLSREGSRYLGEKMNFYGLITGQIN